MKKILLLACCLFCIAPLHSFAFSDIENNTHRDNIEKLTERGLFNGYEDNTFRPNEPVTRAQAVRVLSRFVERADFSQYRLWNEDFSSITEALRYPEGEYIFTDLQYNFSGENDYVLLVAVEVMYSLHILNGYEDGTFRPNEPLKRAQMANMLQKLLVLPTQQHTTAFSDVKSAELKLAVNNLAALAITNGTTPTTFSPNATLTRGQFASFMMRTIEFIEQIKVDVPFTIYKAWEIDYGEVEKFHAPVVITQENAAQYDISPAQLINHQFVVLNYVLGSGCSDEVSKFTFENGQLSIDFAPSIQVASGLLACTASVHNMMAIYQFDLNVDLEQVIIGGQPLFAERK